ncbi:MAG TPA: hypothetical protein VG502_17860 [Flexivirga sp.]|uniref:hypothetical protein n=1 Tax=Flexivirga sp. TaxID=1962927 RepID=UPI002B9058CF|nr:hypothetical protein [Flexivirga sp.]HWC24166.1 hypothetical protein [Flexivirga sp.]
MTDNAITRRELDLRRILRAIGPAAVALSGGVDSMTLAHLSHQELGADVTMFHAASAAVPVAATQRVQEHAERHGWRLELIDAGEFADDRYLANPVNRCFFCKTDLYGTLAAATDAQLLSGTNLDDLGDWRPGLKAAETHHVRHPFVEAEIAKSDVRAIAARHGLDDLAELPAAPCLSSRVETGLTIVPRTLRGIDEVESLVQRELSPEAVRCRVRDSGIVIELDPVTLQRISQDSRDSLTARIRQVFDGSGAVEFAEYVRGSAFLRGSQA